tara:strand:- start:3245 stop:4456 length:1212 start_codon:yes stop_codon:yes gene_type:complete
MALLNETNQQYYQGAQGFIGNNGNTFTATFDTDLVFYDADPNATDYALNNFKLYTSTSGLPGTFAEVVAPGSYSVFRNVITFTVAPVTGTYIVVQLKRLDGGLYGITPAEAAFGETVEENYGSYAYLSIADVVNNFIMGYVGVGKLIPSVKRSEIVFHAKRAIQEFSFDTLRSIHSQELTIPASLGVVLPQDYVNYVKVSWIDNQGVKRPIYPANNLTGNPHNTPIQDSIGIPTQDNFGENIEGTSIIEERWAAADTTITEALFNESLLSGLDWGYGVGFGYGQMYGMDPQYSNSNGWFTMNDREGKMTFSSNLVGKLILLEYISDGLATDLDTKVPKLAEEAMYAYIMHAVIASSINQPEYIVQRLKREKSAKLRNTKIRLSNIKIEEITQVMRGKSKWIKH